ncbi:hypothetical protein ACNQVK_00945 [Mycobacterium sp. 134]|uniref:hypothetical protein n=1 Tax=Mycobacterium sp. 134 TaxID=3400425 RepID=UPI003AACC55E
MTQVAAAYSTAANTLRVAADLLATNPDDPEAVANAYRTTLGVLTGLSATRSAEVGASWDSLYREISRAGTITPDRTREIARLFSILAQNFDAGTDQSSAFPIGGNGWFGGDGRPGSSLS